MRNLCPSTLLILVLTLTLTGCSANYAGERLFWKAQQLHAAITKEPDKATPEQITQAIRAFEQVVQREPGTVWAARAQLAIGTLYVIKQDYAKAREAHAKVLQNYGQYKDLSLTVRFAIAKTYEAENNWDEAVKMYREISDYHPWSPAGLTAPLYIGVGYERRNDPEQAALAFEKAVRFYTKLIPEAPNAELGALVKSQMVSVYQHQQEWNRAIELLQELAEAPKGVNRPLALLTLGSIYQFKLGQPKEAEEVYTTLLQEFPDHQFAKVATTQLQRLHHLVPVDLGAPAGLPDLTPAPATP